MNMISAVFRKYEAYYRLFFIYSKLLISDDILIEYEESFYNNTISSDA